MNLKLFLAIVPDHKNVDKLLNSYSLPFNVMIDAQGTATKNILDFLALDKTEKKLKVAIIPDYLEEELFKKAKTDLKMLKMGNGVAFTISLTSAPKYMLEAFKEKGDKMKSSNDFELVMTIVEEGRGNQVMDAAKKAGANGGTLLTGHGINDAKSFKFFNITMEPEKDVIMIVCEKEKRNAIMEKIIDECGIKTQSKGLCFSLPVDNVVGLNVDDKK